MADIQSRILKKYGIDIKAENPLKLYKVDQPEISSDELEQKISDTRKRWNSSANGANEKFAERDRERLEKAEKYEAILRDTVLRKELYQYYKNPGGGNSAQEEASGTGNTGFAKEYFSLVATTKKLDKKDVDFFFKYYQSERRNKKAILEMLGKELKVKRIGKEESYAKEDEQIDEKGKKKDEKNPILVSLFSEATILRIHRAVDKYEEALKSETVRKKFPELDQGLYQFLDLDPIENAEELKAKMTERGKIVYTVRQDYGTEYVPLVDLFNILQELGEYQDVADNIASFKILMKYPNLTPYMYEFVNMKPSTVKGITEIANRDYVFRDEADFLLTYYNPIHKNFGITDTDIASLLKKAEKRTKNNEFLNKVEEKLGRDKNKRKIPMWAELIHWLVYWPLFAVYFVFEAAKAIFTELHRFAIPAFVLVLTVSNWLLPKMIPIDNLLGLRKLFFKSEWLSYLSIVWDEIPDTMLENYLLTSLLICATIGIYLLPAILIAVFISMFSADFNKRFDWDGLERTFRQMLTNLRKKTEEMYFTDKDIFVKKRIPKILSNVVCLLVFLALINTAGGKAKDMAGNLHPFKKSEAVEKEYTGSADESSGEVERDPAVGRTMVITADQANVRSGPGKENPSLMVAKRGDTFIATGNETTGSNGRTWYEIYIAEGRTGWASEMVIGFQ